MDIPDQVVGYWVFTDNSNFNTGYPRATLISVNDEDFKYYENSIRSVAPTMTGKWAPIWHTNDRGEIRVCRNSAHFHHFKELCRITCLNICLTRAMKSFPKYF